MEIAKELGDNLKFLRKSRHVSAVEIAKYIGIGKKGYYRYETGEIEKIPLENLFKIVKFYRISFDELFSFDSSKKYDSDNDKEDDVEIYPKTIYAIQHNVTKRIYIGSTCKIDRRYKNHISALRKGTHPVEDMQEDFDKYGEDFSLYELGVIDGFENKHLEYSYMTEYESYKRGKGYNYNDPYFAKATIIIPLKQGLPNKQEG